jgi:hypothetical protein
MMKEWDDPAPPFASMLRRSQVIAASRCTLSSNIFLRPKILSEPAADCSASRILRPKKWAMLKNAGLIPRILNDSIDIIFRGVVWPIFWTKAKGILVHLRLQFERID